MIVHDMQIECFGAGLGDIGPWRDATIPQVRDVILAHNMAWLDISEAVPPYAREFRMRPREIETVASLCLDAVQAGRLIDFGYLPNAAVIRGGNRGGPLYHRGLLPQPFRGAWLFSHTWEDGRSVYLVNPSSDDPTGEFEVVELTPVAIKAIRLLSMGDRALLMIGREETPDVRKYHCASAPSLWRYLDGAEVLNNGMSPEASAAGNVLDPAMAALLMLNTRNVQRETVHPDAKLNRARQKSGKRPLPPYDRVNSAPYVTAILARKDRRTVGGGGTHASPIPHLRMGHDRVYPSGKVTFIGDTLVNFDAEAKEQFRSNRSHYTYKAGPARP